MVIVSDRRKRKASTPEPEKQEVGFFWKLTASARHALLMMARRLAPKERSSTRADKVAHDREKLARREEAVQRKLRAAVDKYAEALELFDAWKPATVVEGKFVELTAAKLDAALRGKSATDKLAELGRQQIEWRTVGLGWTSLSHDPDEKQATIALWRRHLLDNIYPHEVAMRRRRQLPSSTAAAHAPRQDAWHGRSRRASARVGERVQRRPPA